VHERSTLHRLVTCVLQRKPLASMVAPAITPSPDGEGRRLAPAGQRISARAGRPARGAAARISANRDESTVHAAVRPPIAVPVWSISLGGWENSIDVDRRLACQGSVPPGQRRFRFLARNALIVGKLANGGLARLPPEKDQQTPPVVSLRVSRLRAASHGGTARYA